MARAVLSNPERRAAGEPLYIRDPRTGASVEVFYAEPVLAQSFGAHAGWFWWTCLLGGLPDVPPHGPFASSYSAYRDATGGAPRAFGRCANLSSDAQDGRC